MPLTQENLHEMYQTAYGKAFRERVFSKDNDIKQAIKNNLNLYKYTDQLLNPENIKARPPLTKDNMIALYQGAIIGYIEDKTISNYQVDKNISYLDKFIEELKDEDSIASKITELLKIEPDKYIQMRECVIGILLTSGTAVGYTQDRASNIIEKLFKPIEKKESSSVNEISGEKQSTGDQRSEVHTFGIFQNETNTKNITDASLNEDKTNKPR
jgi:hypothetical protein